jgi:hypothetical protein
MFKSKLVSVHRQIAIALLVATFCVGCTTVSRPGPPPDTVDCKDAKNATTCTECGGGGHIACCYDVNNCNVLKDPVGPVGRPSDHIDPTAPAKTRSPD